MVERSFNRMVQDQDKNGADDRYQETVQIQARSTTSTEEAEHPSSKDRPCDAEQDIEENTFSLPIDNFAANEAGQQQQQRK